MPPHSSQSLAGPPAVPSTAASPTPHGSPARSLPRSDCAPVDSLGGSTRDTSGRPVQRPPPRLQEYTPPAVRSEPAAWPLPPRTPSDSNPAESAAVPQLPTNRCARSVDPHPTPPLPAIAPAGGPTPPPFLSQTGPAGTASAVATRRPAPPPGRSRNASHPGSPRPECANPSPRLPERSGPPGSFRIPP